MRCVGDGTRDFRVIYLGAIGRRRVAPDMGAMAVHASLGLTGTAGAAADRPCYRLFINTASALRLALPVPPFMYSGGPLLGQHEAARVMGVGVCPSG